MVQTDEELLVHLLRGSALTQVIASAVRFRIPDLTCDRTVTVAELTALTGIDESVLPRYLRTLEALNLIEETSRGTYTGTTLAKLLRRDAGPLYGQALMSGTEYYDAWAQLDQCLTDGVSGLERSAGTTLWDRLLQQPDSAASFARTMGWNSRRALAEVSVFYEFPNIGLIADLGAGDGSFLAGILEGRTALRGIALEHPAMVEHTRRTVRATGLADRCDVVEGDILRGDLPTADLYILKSVLHNWNDDSARMILSHCRRVMQPHSKLLIIERGFDDSDPLASGIRDLTMLVLFGGRDRTADECSTLLRSADFASTEIRAGAAGYFAVEGALA
ncbi:MAG: methyltransferase [Vicinamibacterales bacterium]|jgi:ubiquinone/menaquinone biosynthesis C-methylase UbiE